VTTAELPQIDGLRALAVSMVMADHVWGVAGGPDLRWKLPFAGRSVFLSGWLNRGDLGVPLFFILSGFLLAQSWLRPHYTQAPAPNWTEYFRRRLFRLVPAYYACLLLLLVLFTPSLIPYERVYSARGLRELLAHLSFTQFLFTDTMGSWGVDSPMWTLTHEMAFYLLLPFVAALFVGRRAALTVAVCLAISTGWVCAAKSGLTPLVDFVQAHSSDRATFDSATIRTAYLAPQFPAHLFTFALGIALADWFVRVQLGLSRRPGTPAAGALFVAGCLLLFASVHFIDFDRGSVARTFLVVRNPGQIAGLGLIVAGSVFGAPLVRQSLSAAPVRILGIVSYSMFLWHLPLLILANRYPGMRGYDGGEHLIQLLLRALPLILVISVGSFLLVERPFLRLARRSGAAHPGTKPRSSSPPGAAETVPGLVLSPDA
jgi:peptidoglycan/LPS O-acetylase OafA/YrhL